ncbi:MAG: thiamine biosynthesis protein ThiF [Campylobacterota bacterium]|nr:thiamine biosynthesis protein ThiF [Campylobacterota bacterium]
MMVGSKISCIGIVGDGCGGGREFIIEDEVLFAYDPQTEEKIVLLENIKNVKAISKKGCKLFIECEDNNFKFDLSLMKVV